VRKVILGLSVLIGATAQLLQAQQTPPLAASPARPPDAAALGAVHSNIAYGTAIGGVLVRCVSGAAIKK
jgi:hypothetical protein